MAESRWTRSMLLDFYGELLTEKQRECFDLHYNEDLSLSEIAEQLGISRQGVWDNIRKAESVLEDVERKTGLLRRFEENREALEELYRKIERLRELSGEEGKALADECAWRVRALIDRG